jgi:uncharacterized protein
MSKWENSAHGGTSGRRIQLGGRHVPGLVYRADGAWPRPTVVLAGGWCYVREVVMPTCAAAFAAAGVNALVFDYRNLGVSDGDNRQHLDPWAQIRDLPERDLVP